jgi:N-acetylmuramoyl-L-alanine amidase
MLINDAHRLELDNEFEHFVRFEKSPNARPNLQPKYLVLHATIGPTVQSAVNWFKLGDRSVHLVVGRDGREIVQMVDFNKRAVHAHEYNVNSIGIELDYPGYLIERKNYFRSIDRFEPHEMVQATAENDWKVRFWPLYPARQLDLLLKITRVLLDRYPIEEILGHEEINEGKTDPGPLFPLTLFKEKLRSAGAAPLAVETLSRPVSVHNGPGKQFARLLDHNLPAGTPVSVAGDDHGWARIEVLEAVDGNSWFIGWVEASAVAARRSVPVINKQRLFTQGGRRYKFIKPYFGNFNSERKIREHKYLVMHVTTGTQLQSTINWFRSPNSGVSSHLLIGRDGRVIQFVPFDTVAYHAGFSYWEGDRFLNDLSIGIELDNAAYLSRRDGLWKRKRTVIDPAEVQVARHWKESTERGWQKFTQIQLDVALDIAQRLVQEYGIKEILGHDMVNLPARYDPGPLFPMEDWREALFGRREPLVAAFETKVDADLYENNEHVPPNLNRPVFPNLLPAKSGLRIINRQGNWTLVRVKVAPGFFRDKVGWLESKFIDPNTHKTTLAMQFFPDLSGGFAGPPASRVTGSPLPAGTRVRIQEFNGDWALVATLGVVKNRPWLEGWLLKELLIPVDG